MASSYGINLNTFNPTHTLSGIPSAVQGVANTNNVIQSALNPAGPKNPGDYATDVGAVPAPNPVTTTTTTGTGTGYGSVPSASASYYNSLIDQINNQIGRLPSQANLGHQNIADSFTSANNGLQTQHNQATRDYETQRGNTQQDNQAARAQIASGAHQGLTSLQRLLGINGAGSSSAATIAAPYAVGLEANNQTQQVQNAYGRNISGIDTAHGDSENQFTNSFNSLNDDRANRDRSLDSQLAQTHENLLNQLGQFKSFIGQPVDPTLTPQVNALGAQVDALSRQQVTAPQAVSYAAPNLTAYNYDPTKAPVDSNAGSNLGAFYNLIGSQDPNKKLVGAPQPVAG